MKRTTSQKRPWLAALLGALATGFGHLYLRRWRRAVGWFVALFAVSYVFVDPAAIRALAAGEAVDPLRVAPTLLVGGASVVDAYVLARAQNALARAREAAEESAVTVEGATEPEAAIDSCPNCGKDVDPELDFCHWCTADLSATGGDTGGAGDGASDRR
jgi:hypothetical protein